MTTIDGTQGAYRLTLDAHTSVIVNNLAVRTGMAPAEVVRLLVAAANDNLAPLVDAGNMTPGSPGDGRGAGGVVATPAPVPFSPVDLLTELEASPGRANPTHAAPVSHAAPVHVHLGGGPCVYGERCGQ